jgi:hypothetical protein
MADIAIVGIPPDGAGLVGTSAAMVRGFGDDGGAARLAGADGIGAVVLALMAATGAAAGVVMDIGAECVLTARL